MSSLSPIPISQACPRCHGAEILFTPTAERSLASVCECVAECQLCHGTGRLFREKDGALFAELCGCSSRKRRVELYNRANIPLHFCGKGFGSFQAYESALGAVRQRVESFAQGYPNFGKGVLLWGRTGTGKTHLLTAALQYLTLERGVPARYVEFSFLVSEIKEAFMRNVSALVALAPLADVEVLAIDELGKGRSTEFERETLDELISRRYNANRTTIFATNFNAAPRKAEPASGGAWSNPLQVAREGLSDQHLQERVGDRTFSRLAEMAEPIQVNARDRRVPPG
jgi:DNA replication protein DnaC